MAACRATVAALAILVEIHPAALCIGAMDNVSTGIETRRLLDASTDGPSTVELGEDIISWCVQKQVCPRSCPVKGKLPGKRQAAR
jgi:hypothetical protein